VFALAAEGEHSYAEIAAVLGIPVGTVMSRLFHARRKLSEQLADLAPRERRSAASE
jgi:RNA polymerase sigma-70 factor (ECF subfamily)